MATTIVGTPFQSNSFASSRGGAGASWTFVGLSSSFPNVDGTDVESLAEKRSCADSSSAAGCRVFRIPRPTAGLGGAGLNLNEDDVEEIAPEDAGSAAYIKSMRDQVLVFQYKGKFHAVDNVSFPSLLVSPAFLAISPCSFDNDPLITSTDQSPYTKRFETSVFHPFAVGEKNEGIEC